MRVRIDGKVHEIDALPKLDKNKKHTIDVVVDRLKVRADVKQRLAESFETALRHCRRQALAVEMDSGKEHLFSAKFACPVCGYSLPELEPRLFSFNNPMGACPKCDGLGQISFFDPKRVVAFPHLSLAAGAIKGWDKRNQFYFQMLQSLALHYGFDLDSAVRGAAGKHPAHSALRQRQGVTAVPVSRRKRRDADAQPSVRRHHPQFRAPLPRNRIVDGARGTGEIPQLPASVPTARARGCAPRRAMCWSAARRCSRSAGCR